MSFPLPDHEVDGGGPNQPLHKETIGQSIFPVKVLNKETGLLEDVVHEDPTTLHPGKYLMGIMIIRVMNLLITMSKTLERVAVFQAEKLSFFSKMQNANTALMNTVHTFVLNNSDPIYISGKETEQNTARQNLNQKMTGDIEEIKATNNLYTNTAKQVQTNVNQTQDKVSQQSNMLTSLIQQMRSINSAISRG